MSVKIDEKKLCANFGAYKPEKDKINIIFEIINEDENSNPVEGTFNDWGEFRNFKDFLSYILDNSDNIREAITNEYPEYRLRIKVGDGENHIMLESNENEFSILGCYILIEQLLSDTSNKLIDKFDRIKKIIDEK